MAKPAFHSRLHSAERRLTGRGSMTRGTPALLSRCLFILLPLNVFATLMPTMVTTETTITSSTSKGVDTTTPSTTQSTSSATPSPHCEYSLQGTNAKLAKLYTLSNSNSTASPTDLLYTLREQVCNSTACTAPGIEAAIAAKDKQYKVCEITIGLANGVEAYTRRRGEANETQCREYMGSMIGTIDGLLKDCWWHSEGGDLGYGAGFKVLNGNETLHVEQGVGHTAVLAVATAEPDAKTTGEAENPEGKGSNLAAIVGGVVGGLAFLAILVGLLWLMWIRRKRQNTARKGSLEVQVGLMEEEHLNERKEKEKRKAVHEMSSERACHEVNGEQKPVELGDRR